MSVASSWSFLWNECTSVRVQKRARGPRKNVRMYVHHNIVSDAAAMTPRPESCLATGTMAIGIMNDAPVVEATWHASCDLQKQWEESCAKAMGFDRGAPLSHDNDSSSAAIHILNLMDDNGDTTMDETNDYIMEDHWMDNANQIAASISQMADMIVKNARPYVTGDLTDEEASVLESTVLSFSATAANQIDALRGAIDHSQSHDYVQHCSGIVAALMLCLREHVANPMASLQKQRTRTAMTIYQQPLSCRLVLKDDNNVEMDGTVWDQLVEDDQGGSEQRFCPQHEAPSMSTDFMAAVCFRSR